MIYYLTEKSNGILLNGELPAGAVECTQEQYNNAGAWIVENGKIAPNPNLLANIQKAQIQILSRSCAQQIISGFSSSALGVAYIYASDQTDQRNIVQSAQSTKGGLLSCADSAGVWSRQPHTQAQAVQVLEDFVTMRDICRMQLSALEAQVAAATTVEAVQGVVWESAGG